MFHSGWGFLKKSPVSMDSRAISTRFAGRGMCRHPQIPASGVALNCNALVAQLKHGLITCRCVSFLEQVQGHAV